jgi:hypothetical protein
LTAYFDGGFLFKLYWQEANTRAAQTIVAQFQPPLPFSRLNEVEMLHVARRKTWLTGTDGKPLLSASQFQLGVVLLQQDLADGILSRFDIDYDQLFDRALGLSSKYGQNLPIKTADLLHVSMMTFGFDCFVTADRQQHEFANTAGLRCIFLGR